MSRRKLNTSDLPEGAIIEEGGKQYVVEDGDLVPVDKDEVGKETAEESTQVSFIWTILAIVICYLLLIFCYKVFLFVVGAIMSLIVLAAVLKVKVK